MAKKNGQQGGGRLDRQWALDAGYTFEWSDSEDSLESLGADPSISADDIESIAELDMLDAEGNIVQSLGGIMLGYHEAPGVHADFEDRLAGQERRETGHEPSAHPAGLLERVNRDRARRGQAALAPGDWTTADLEEFVRHLRRGNPALKRKLLRR